jgi:hypothetical protein
MAQEERIPLTSDIESRFQLLMRQTSKRLSRFEAPAFHRTLLIFLVGLELVFDCLQFFILSIWRVKKEVLLVLFVRICLPEPKGHPNKAPANMSNLG